MLRRAWSSLVRGDGEVLPLIVRGSPHFVGWDSRARNETGGKKRLGETMLMEGDPGGCALFFPAVLCFLSVSVFPFR